MGFSERELEEMTRDFWDKTKDLSLKDTMITYIRDLLWDNKSLFRMELERAEEKGRIKTTFCKTLVLLVGFSLEPLLQSIYVYKPEKIVLILNKDGYYTEQLEQWFHFARDVVYLVKILCEERLLARQPIFLKKDGSNDPGYPTADDPKEVFKTLLEALRDEEEVIIDITGGKKNMVTGAFLYAAYSGIPISYVDFEKYDYKCRRPYGYTCKIEELTNPYREFALREWERVRELYRRYQFEEAKKLLKENIAPAMRDVLPDSDPALKRLQAYLDFYALWDRGDFRAAKNAATGLGDFEQPTAVVELGDKWYQIEDDDYRKIKAEDFFGDRRVVLVYAYDELARIRRLIEYNGDYRSAFVRAGGVNEIIMNARIVDLITDKMDKSIYLQALNKKTPGIWDIFAGLSNSKEIITVKDDIPFRFKNAPNIIISKPKAMASWWQKTDLFNDNNGGWQRFLIIRNELMHAYFSVPKDWAEEALCFVEANFEDFLGHPIDELKTGEHKIHTEALPWPKLCELCGLSPFLPHGLRKQD